MIDRKRENTVTRGSSVRIAIKIAISHMAAYNRAAGLPDTDDVTQKLYEALHKAEQLK